LNSEHNIQENRRTGTHAAIPHTVLDMNGKSNASPGPYEFNNCIKITPIIRYIKDRHTFMNIM